MPVVSLLTEEELDKQEQEETSRPRKKTLSKKETLGLMGPVPASAEPQMEAKAKRALAIRQPKTPTEGILEEEGPSLDLGPQVDLSMPELEYNLDVSKNPHDKAIVGLSTIPDDQQGLSLTRNVTNFLLGPEMGVMGVKWDTQGLSWSWENAKEQWASSPTWVNLLATTSLFGTAFMPIAKAAHMTTSVGRVGEALGFTGSHIDEITRWKSMDLLDQTHTTPLNFKTRKAMRIFEKNTEKWNAMRDRAVRAEQGALVGPKEKMLHAFESRFTNTYFNMATSNNAKIAYNARLQDLWKNERIGEFFVGIPDADMGQSLYQYRLHKLDPNNVPAPTGLSKEAKDWADRVHPQLLATQKEMLEEGIIDEATFQRIGEFHMPAQYKGTPEADLSMTQTVIAPLTERGGNVAIKVQKMPRLDSKTLSHRTSDLPEIYQRLQAGQLITDPTDVSVRGYVTDRLLLNNFKYVRESAMDARYGAKHADIVTKYTRNGVFDPKLARKAGWIHLNTVGGGVTPRLRKMFEKKGPSHLGINGELPWIRKEVYDEVFGEHGIFAQAQNAVGWLDITNSMFKTMKTGANVQSHFNNAAGNGVFLSMAGFNPFTPESMNLMKGVSRAFNNMSDVWQTSKKAGVNTKDIFQQARFNMGTITHKGKTFDLNQEFLNPAARQLIEENTLDATEALSHLEDLYTKAAEGSVKKNFLAAALKVKDIAQVNNKVKWFDKMNKAYVAEDMIPKMALFLDYRAQGFSPVAAAIEVGRRMPMYNTVGSAVIGGRKTVFPWLTFTTEATRIMKNNLMDYPLRAMPWLQLPAIMQSVMAGIEGRSFEDVQEAKRNLPLFAQSPTTVIASGQTQTGIAGGASGAFVGAVGGSLLGGAPGGIAGGILGGVAGALGGMMINKDEDSLRGAMLDFLPHSAFMLTSTSPDFEWSGPQQFVEQMPSQPLAIVKPLMDVWAGQTAWGTEVGSEGPADAMGKMLAGMIGVMSPPLIQKYGFRVTTPDISASQALLGTDVPGDITNVSRALIDAGIQIDPMTGKPGNLTQDFLLNNFGMWKSFGASPPGRLSNEALLERNQQKIRTYLSKNLDFHLANGNDAQSSEILMKVQRSFAAQYVNDPKTAQEKFASWLSKHHKSLGQHPRLRNWSKEELASRLKTSLDYSLEVRGQAREEMIEFLRQEQRVRNMGQLVRSPGVPRSQLLGGGGTKSGLL